ncbi:fungal specific transcription factor domain-containing protein [Colletotrichum graminicola]|uniref:Fungal specific transcription factor domain-containing protein n=1 Tax=Colletotrichum graminicola (strain M1.001 / M2 / FGSC 10212) TaxID=645133 RepID=E3QWJ3_COLGM|nr:fungal specific transcription factor domain-containing protein [Colletotrichum graminicola M1.001]EFQ35231.1 fungal specific transcription factor domain-containing protein [Colletotrichum graminicola M1.001]WDK14447.1 fungal specific transcription factor domain-containing protein [Colletotrichum graminicola]
MSTGRKIGKRACDACKIRKIKCTEVPPCDGCVAIRTACTFNKVPATRGPRNLRAKTIRQIAQAQQESAAAPPSSDSPTGDGAAVASTPAGAAAPSRSSLSPDGASSEGAGDPTGRLRLVRQETTALQAQRTPSASLVLRLCIYRLRLFPVWPIIAVEEIMASLSRDADDLDSYVLANAVGAATIAQLKLTTTDNDDPATASSMEAECQRSRMALQEREGGPPMNLNWLRTSFFLHVYHENQQPGGAKSLLYLREAITIAQIMGLHKESSYMALPLPEQQMKRRILWLLFVTERGVAMLHKLPVVLKSNIRFPSLDGSGVGEDEGHVLPAFKKLANLFWIFDQSGAFDILQNSDDEDAMWSMADGLQTASRACLDVVQRKLQEIPLDSDASNDVQRADIVVTRQWMQAVLWKVTMNHGRPWSSGDCSNDNNTNNNSTNVTSLSHPIHIAKEFLQLISQLPSTAIEAHGPGIEFKIYEIASAVTDAVANNFRLPRSSTDGPRDILLQLQRVLASCRGGNKALLEMLCARISEIQHGPLLAMNKTLTPRVQEIDDDQWRNERAAPANGQTNLFTATNDMPDSNQTYAQAQASFLSMFNRDGAAQSLGSSGPMPIPLQRQDLGRPIWDHQNQMGPGAHDLIEQLQNFDGSFNAVESNGTLDMLFANGVSWDNVANDDWMASVQNNPGAFNSSTQPSTDLQRTYE